MHAGPTEQPTLDHDLDRLLHIELPPFQRAIDAGVATIMTSHILFRQIDPERLLAACLACQNGER